MGLDGGNFGMAASYGAGAATARANARVARAQGEAAMSAARGQAARQEQENMVAGHQASGNMARLREAGNAAAGQVDAARGALGLTAEGTGLAANESVLERFERTASDMAYSRSIMDQGARFTAAMTRKQGEFALAGASIEGQYQDAQAGIQDMLKRNAQMAGWTSVGASLGGLIVGGAIGGGVGAMKGLQIGQGAASMFNRTLTGSAEAMGHGNTYAEKFLAQSMAEWLT